MARERSRGRLSPARGREAAAPSPGIGLEAQFADALAGGTPGEGDMLKSVYDPASIVQQLVGTLAAQILQGKTLVSPVMTTGILLSNIGPDYTIGWDIPPVGITLLIENPGVATDYFSFRSATESLRNKTLFTPAIADFSLAQHDHADAAGGGVVGASDFAWVMGATSPQVVTTSWVTVGADQIPEEGGDPFTLVSDGIFPPSQGQYAVSASTRWNCDDEGDGDIVQVRWQRYNSIAGAWETILGT